MVFPLYNFTFGDPDVETVELTTSISSSALVQLGFNGLGLPSFAFSEVVIQLNEANDNIDCDEVNFGGYCTYTGTCLELFPDVDGLEFRLVFDSQLDYQLRFPISSVMRNGVNSDGEDICNILLINLSNKINNPDNYFILGDVFLQNFFTEFSLNLVANTPMMYLTTQPDVLPGTEIVND